MENRYALLLDRVKAIIIDGILLIAAMYGISEFFNLFEYVHKGFRIAAFLAIFVFYDPFFTSRYGATIGHSYSGIEVKKESDIKSNISFPAAIIRFVLKAMLGWVSLLTVATNAKKQAIHDRAARSVVLKSED